MFRSSTKLDIVKVDIEDLLNAAEVAQVLGLAHREAISTYRRRYANFPEPAVKKGTCVLWLRSDVERWAKVTGRTAGVPARILPEC